MIIFELSTLYIHEKENTSLNLIKKYEILTRDCLENHFVHRGASVFYKEGFSEKIPHIVITTVQTYLGHWKTAVF